MGQLQQPAEPALAEPVASSGPTANRNVKALGGLRPPSAPSAGLAREGEADLRLRYQQNRGGSAGRLNGGVQIEVFNTDQLKATNVCVDGTSTKFLSSPTGHYTVSFGLISD